MMPNEREIAENLRDAGCDAVEVRSILDSLQCGDRRKAERLMDSCREKQLRRLHESQRRIDRLDYLRYQLQRGE
ncbi:MAG: hypothetical protein IIZ26_04605 [Oscillospiraceae bacterium]|nr:hypothetical protein [Oscillospiraceae bacterium]